MQERILIVEDDEDIRSLLAYNLKKEGYITIEAENGKIALDYIENTRPELILLDVMMPVLDGLGLCKALNQRNISIPLVMLSAKGEDIDKILGLELGADDYVVKPFNIRELLLRIKSCLKRQNPQNTVNNLDTSQILEHNGIQLNILEHAVLVDNTTIYLTATEFRLLEDLIRHKGQVRTREQLLDAVWGYEFDGYGRTVDTHIRRVRAKIRQENSIETVRGIGYKFIV